MSGSFLVGPVNLPTCDYTALSAAGSETGTIEFYKDSGGGVQPIDSTSDTVSQVVMQDDTDSDVVTITGISVLFSDFNDALTAAGGNSFDQYAAFVSLMNGDVTIEGNGNANLFLEVGTGGTATVTAGGGDDVLRVWQDKTVAFNGGGGTDLITFQAIDGPYPVAPTQGAVVNLSTGTGTNPYGGTLTLTNVENVIGTPLGDTLTGNNKANVFGDGIYDAGPDQINGMGGDDTVNLAEGTNTTSHAAVHADGGAGTDTLAVNFALIMQGVQKLDLTNQANNTGVFGNSTFDNFEVFVHGTGFWSATGNTFIFIDTNDGHTVEAMGETNKLTLNGGNDTVLLTGSSASSRTVTADGGSGKDTLKFEVSYLAANNRLDLVHPGKDSGVFAGDSFKNFEVFRHVENDEANTSTQKFTFIGDGKAQTVIGAVGVDILKGGGGNDTLNGGENDDKLTGGSGKDHFVFNTAIGNPLPLFVNIDTITDFKPGTDRIELENKIFKGIGGSGTLASKDFHVGSKATSKAQHIIYNKHTGVLYYDPDGTGTKSQIEFADLHKGLGLGHHDFLVI
jgi:serralysin